MTGLALSSCCHEPGSTDEQGSAAESETSSESESATESTSEASTSETATSETGPECGSSEDCSVAAPICEAGSCVACDEAQTLTCASERPDTPVCRVEDGQCVECSSADTSACAVELPICVANLCSGCRLHADCPASGCNMETGACMPTDRVWYVDDDVVASGDGSEAAPYDSVLEVLPNIDIGESGTVIVVTKLNHTDTIDVQNYRTLAVVDRTVDGWFSGNGEPAMVLGNHAKVFIDSFVLRSFTDTAVYCTLSDLWIRDALVRGVNDTISATSCNLHVESSTLAASGGWTLFLDNTSLELTNSFVAGANDYDTIELDPDSEATIVYSTIVGGYFDSAAIHCGLGATGVGSSVRNSILASFANTPEVGECPDLSVTDSALEGSLGDNLSLGGVQATWFEDYNGGDFHLTPMSPPTLAGAGVWREGDPRVDIDGDPRPAVAGSVDSVGADLRPR